MKKIILFTITFLIITTVQAESIRVSFESCSDGDTAHFNYNNKSIKVRFLAINAPEIEHDNNPSEFMGEEAKDFVCSSLANAKKIRLEFDNNSNKEDKYGRTLAWVWLDDKLLQELLVEQGLAKVDYIYDEYLYVPYLCQVEKKAFSKKIGIWEKNKKLGYCSKIEDNNYTLEELQNEKLEDINISPSDKILIGVIAFFILFITLITMFIIKRS